MKKLLLAILAALALTGVQAQAFPDIPAGHWAGDAVQRIADLGIVIGFPDGTYRGNEGFTRYQAALVISRLLDVIRADMDAMKALVDADIASLRNALQELASDVAAQDVRLNAVEGAVASISDDTASNTARIEALEAAWADMDSMGMDPAVLADLQNQLDALRVATDTAQSGVDQNTASINAINDLLALLNADVEDLKGMSAPEVDLSGIQGQVDRNASDIANIREFVILLRRDQVALRDRVAALEASDASQQAALDDLAARVTKIEEDLFLVTGSIELKYRVDRLSGANIGIDADRVWGINNMRNIGTSVFSSGTEDYDEDDDTDEDGDRTQDREDITDAGQDNDEFSSTVTINLDWNTGRNGAGSPNALNSFESVIKLKTKKAVNLCLDGGNQKVAGDADGDGVVEAGETVDVFVCTDDDDPFSGYVFAIDKFTATFDPIGAAPLTFQYGEAPSAHFTPYHFDSMGPGFVATLGSPDFLAFLNPTLTVAYGAAAEQAYNGDDDVDPKNSYYRGIRGTLSPIQGDTFSATGGFSYSNLSVAAGENADALKDNEEVTVWGLDGNIGVSILDLTFEYASQSLTEVGTKDTKLGTLVTVPNASLMYVKANVDVASIGIPVLKSLEANYRMIPKDWFGNELDGDDRPFGEDQTGFGVKATLNLFILDITGYFDSYTTADSTEALDTDTDTEAVSAFGVDASAPLFAGFSVNGFFHNASINGTAVDNVEDANDKDEKQLAANDLDRDGAFVKPYDTGFGVTLKHDGASANALIPNLNLEAYFKQTDADFDTTKIGVKADYTLKVSIVELTPYVGFESSTDADADTDDTSTIKAGTGIKTDALDIIFKPSLEAAVNFRSTSHTDADVYTATELQWGVGLTLNQFLLDHSVLRARYGSWSGKNISLSLVDNKSEGTATNISVGDEFNGSTQTTTGYEINWDYFDLTFGYAAYTASVEGADAVAFPGRNGNSAGQAFKIAYTVNF